MPINLGLAGGFQAGAKYAYLKGYDCFIQFDADGQHLPEYIDKMLKKLDEGYDIVIGSRFVDEKKPISARMLGSRLISTAIKLTTAGVVLKIAKCLFKASEISFLFLYNFFNAGIIM